MPVLKLRLLPWPQAAAIPAWVLSLLAGWWVPAATAQSTASLEADAKVPALLEEFLSEHPEGWNQLPQQSFSETPLTREEAEQVKDVLWAFRAKQLREERKEEFEAHKITLDGLSMPYTMHTFGEKPEAGHSLTISMHGGGNTAKRVNDQQWRNQQRLYELQEGIYVAPRAPTDTWNLWHEAHIDTFFTRLIQNMLLFEHVDTNRVYITGYSAGGDGVYQLAPRMADQLAAAAMMAGHPNETQPDGLRNLPFTLHVGANDDGYGRNDQALKWKQLLGDLHAADAGGYQHWAKLHDGKGHWMDRQDAEGVQWMQQFRRNMVPERIVWLQDDVTHSRFYWLGVSGTPKARARVVASRKGNHIQIESDDLEQLTLLLRDDMIDFDEAVQVAWGSDSNSQTVFTGSVARTLRTIHQTLSDRNDPNAVFSGQLSVSRPAN